MFVWFRLLDIDWYIDCLIDINMVMIDIDIAIDI